MSSEKDLVNGAKSVAKTVLHKTSDFIEATKLSINVSNKEDSIEKYFAKIGKLVYESHENGKDIIDEMKQICEEVDSEEAKIRILKRKIADIRQTLVCKSCDATMKKDALFCPKCGIRI
ncbi:MAG: hypothetical protein WCQ41_03055 [Bacillota bacterium]